MTVKELEAILATVENKDMEVRGTSYCSNKINGYFFDEDNNKEVLMLTPLHVIPSNK